MRIGVIGLGAIGLFVASQLSKSHEVTGYARREEQLEKLRHQGVVLNHQSYKFDCQIIDNLKEHDLIIVCVKQTQLDYVLPYIQSAKNTVCFLQNGLGHIEKVSQLNAAVAIGICEHGVSKLDDYEIQLNGLGQIQMAALYSKDQKEIINIVDAINQRYFPVNYTDQLYSILNEKLVVNSVINPLTAILNIKNGIIIENPYLKKLAYNLTLEAAQTLSLDFNKCWRKVQSVIESTKNNNSSMLNDINSGRLTEIDYINGYILKISKQPLPLQQSVYQLVKAKEKL